MRRYCSLLTGINYNRPSARRREEDIGLFNEPTKYRRLKIIRLLTALFMILISFGGVFHRNVARRRDKCFHVFRDNRSIGDSEWRRLVVAGLKISVSLDTRSELTCRPTDEKHLVAFSRIVYSTRVRLYIGLTATSRIVRHCDK